MAITATAPQQCTDIIVVHPYVREINQTQTTQECIQRRLSVLHGTASIPAPELEH